MPTYEYQCDKCKKSFDAYQSMKDPTFATCPKELCRQKTWGKGKVRRQIGTGAGIIFKGSGFYSTDYRSEGYNSDARSAAKADHAEFKESSKTETKSESKPEPKTESKPAPAEKKPKAGTKKD